jgi:predicted ribosome quality control (RQC) complex YloA/Tae2 family protein
MEVKIDFTKSAQDNADELYKKAKKLLAKKAGTANAIKELQKKLELANQKSVQQAPKVLKVAKIEWYEKFHWFFTSSGMLAIGGRDAQQNELINSRYFGEEDLFFHADIFGAPVVVLKDGAGADVSTKEEVAQFAACYSSAWKQMLGVVDVYAMRRAQVSKSTQEGYLGTGSFLLKGEREWYRNMKLELVMFLDEGRLMAAPSKAFEKMREKMKCARIAQGDSIKSDAAKRIAHILGYDNLDSIMVRLPAGTFSVSAGI